MAEKFKNYISGKWGDAKSGKTFQNINPADTSDIVGEFPQSGIEDVNEAVAAAVKPCERAPKTPAPRRAEIIFKAGDILIQRKEEISREMTREMGKILKETRGDVQEGIDTAFLHAGEGRRLFGFTTPSELQSKFAMAIRMPVGVCGLITPWNFPLAIPTWKIFPALVAGHTVVLKPAKDTPLLAHLFVEILIEAGLPPGVVNLVHGLGEEAGAALVRHPGGNLVSFTGSTT